MSEEKPPKFFKFALVALPVGIIVGGVISMFFYFSGDGQSGETGTRQAQTIKGKDLEKYVRTLTGEKVGPRYVGAPNDGLARAAKYIESVLGPTNTGYAIQRNTYKVGAEDVSNLIAELKGTTKADEIIVIGAHYDSVPGSPGADDNASGVAAMISLARAMVDKKPERTIRFVAFANEEPPYFRTDFMGSHVYAKLCRGKRDNIVAMLSLESMGYYSDEPGSQKFPDGGLAKLFPDKGDFIAFVGNLDSRELLERTVGLFKERSVFPAYGEALPGLIEGVGWSDHWSFWQFGYPAVMVTDTAPFRNPHYHKASDTADTLDFAKFEQVVLALEDVIWDLANPSKAPRTDYKSRAVELLRDAGR